MDKKLLSVSPYNFGMEDSSEANITKTHTVHAEGTTEKVLQIPTDTEAPSHNTVICTDTELKNGTSIELSGQALQTKNEMAVDLTSDITEKSYQQESKLQFGLDIHFAG